MERQMEQNLLGGNKYFNKMFNDAKWSKRLSPALLQS